MVANYVVRVEVEVPYRGSRQQAIDEAQAAFPNGRIVSVYPEPTPEPEPGTFHGWQVRQDERLAIIEAKAESTKRVTDALVDDVARHEALEARLAKVEAAVHHARATFEDIGQTATYASEVMM